MPFDIQKGQRVLDTEFHGGVPKAYTELTDQTASSTRTDAGFELSALSAMIYQSATTGSPTAVIYSIEVADDSAGTNATTIASGLVAGSVGSVVLKGPVPRTGKRFWRIRQDFVGGTSPTATYDAVVHAV